MLVAGAVAVVALFFEYRCPIKLLTGFPCPTCGITRACRLVARGDFAAATRMHPMVWIAVPVVLFIVGVELAGYAQTRTWGASRRMRGGEALMALTAALLFALWIARFAGLFGGPVE